MARPSALVAEGAAPSKGVALSARLTYVQGFCLRLLATPTTMFLREAHGFLAELLESACFSIVKALSPRLSLKMRRDYLVDGQLIMGALLGLIDTLLRVPPPLLLRRWPQESSVTTSLTYTVISLLDATVSYDRAAAALGMPLYDGGPLAGLCLPGGVA